MQLTHWGKYFEKDMIQSIWEETFGGIRVKFYPKSALVKKPINLNKPSYVSTGTSCPKDQPDQAKMFEMSFKEKSKPIGTTH